MIAKRTFYSGRVQGVGFRYSTKQIAMGFEVTGTVRNLRAQRALVLSTFHELARSRN